MKISFLIFLTSFFYGCSTTVQDHQFPQTVTTSQNIQIESTSPSKKVKEFGLEVPALKANEKLYVRHGYYLSFNSSEKIANWVGYSITKEKLNSTVASRSNNFHADNNVEGGSALPKDYARSGFDKGHLAPAVDMAWSVESMSDSFLMSNMTPQRPKLNRGIWKNLEEKVRGWTKKYGKVYVVTGPILSEAEGKLPNSAVTIPRKFFKVLLEEGSEQKAIGFIIPQNYNSNDIKDYAVSVDSVEAITGINFFSQLPDEVEKRIEAENNFSTWFNEDVQTNRTVQSSNNFSNASACPIDSQLMPATIRGCCSHHNGVAGPKKSQACCKEDKRVLCNDGSTSPSCRCY
ncbi:MAG: DNA/RNA non-specific endonuclease [Bdellovibrio sp.]|nr:DNA/RNA non-specific endonuclease [Bdellovibrio sp.]